MSEQPRSLPVKVHHFLDDSKGRSEEWKEEMDDWTIYVSLVKTHKFLTNEQRRDEKKVDE